MKCKNCETVLGAVAVVAFLTVLTYVVMAGFACFAAWTPEYWDITAWHPYARGALGLAFLGYSWCIFEVALA